jgi:hypothetical protein
MVMSDVYVHAHMLGKLHSRCTRDNNPGSDETRAIWDSDVARICEIQVKIVLDIGRSIVLSANHGRRRVNLAKTIPVTVLQSSGIRDPGILG